jgi:transcription elongation GreA/GreB family factor
LQQQLRQRVSDNAKLPTAKDARARRQLDQADQAQRDRERARQQDLLDRERDAADLPRVVPQALPAPKQSGG